MRVVLNSSSSSSSNLDVHSGPADGGGGTHARQTIRWRVLGGPCAWVARRYPPPPARRSLVPSSLSTTSRAPRGQLLLLAVPSSCSSLPSAVPRAATDRADHAASVPPAALRTPSTRRADEPPGLSHVQTARRRGPPADHASSSQSDECGAPHFARDARDSAARWRSDRRGGGRGRAAGGGGGAAVRLRTFAIARAPPASTLSLTSALPT